MATATITKKRGNRATIRVTGPFQCSTEEMKLPVLRKDIKNVTVDLQGADGFDSHTFVRLLVLHDEILRRGGNLRIVVRPNTQAHRICHHAQPIINKLRKLRVHFSDIDKN
jgi:ribosomal protein S10